MEISEGRCVGLEQEFFLVDEDGVLSNRADEFLTLCKEEAEASGRAPEGFAPECARMYAYSRGASRVLSGTSTPPAPGTA